MKKIIITIFLSCFMGASFAEYDFSGAIQSSSMPSDDEIMAIVKQFNFTQEQEKAIFKDVKKKLQVMYSGENVQKTNSELNQYFNQVEKGTFDKVMDPSMKKELVRDVSKMPKTNTAPINQTSDNN